MFSFRRSYLVRSFLLVSMIAATAAHAEIKIYYGYDFWDIQSQITFDKAMEGYDQAKKDLVKFSQDLNQTRADYWAAVAAGRKDPSLKAKYTRLLDDRDMMWLFAAFASGELAPGGINGREPTMEGLLFAPVAAVDGGVPWTLRSEFYDWGFKMAKSSKLNRQGTINSLDDFAGVVLQVAKAFVAARSLPEYQVYVRARNRAEYDASGLPGRFSAGDYLDYLLDGAYPSEADRAAARKALLENLNQSDLLEIATEIQRAPKNERGLPTVNEMAGPPHRLFQRLVRYRLPRAYAAAAAYYVTKGDVAEKKEAGDYWPAAFSALAQLETAYGEDAVAAAVAQIRSQQPYGPYHKFSKQEDIGNGKIRETTPPLQAGGVTIREDTLGRALLGFLVLANPDTYLLQLARAHAGDPSRSAATSLLAEIKSRHGPAAFRRAMDDLLLVERLGYGDARKAWDYQLEFKDDGLRDRLRQACETATPAHLAIGAQTFSYLLFDDRAAFELWTALLSGEARVTERPYTIKPEYSAWAKAVPGSSLSYATTEYDDNPVTKTAPTEAKLELRLQQANETSATVEVRSSWDGKPMSSAEVAIQGRLRQPSPDRLDYAPGEDFAMSRAEDKVSRDEEFKPGFHLPEFPNLRHYQRSQETITVAGQQVDCIVYSYDKTHYYTDRQGEHWFAELHDRIWTNDAIPTPGADSPATSRAWGTPLAGTVRQVSVRRTAHLEADQQDGEMTGWIWTRTFEGGIDRLELRDEHGAPRTFHSPSFESGPPVSIPGVPPESMSPYERYGSPAPVALGGANLQVRIVPIAAWKRVGHFWDAAPCLILNPHLASINFGTDERAQDWDAGFFDADGVLTKITSYVQAQGKLAKFWAPRAGASGTGPKKPLEAFTLDAKYLLLLPPGAFAANQIRPGVRLDLAQVRRALVRRHILPELFDYAGSGAASAPSGGTSTQSAPSATAVTGNGDKEFDVPPRLISGSGPEYPFEMRRAGITGEVTVEFTINVDGSVSDVRVAKSSAREFEAPAVAAAAGWKFKPAMKGNKPVPLRTTQVLKFALD
ncbi:MAG TPA: energy transducer TonB [Lacunisphaera sp.]|nr:energy transducer TonB [Lacunisphaera sp.]